MIGEGNYTARVFQSSADGGGGGAVRVAVSVAEARGVRSTV